MIESMVSEMDTIVFKLYMAGDSSNSARALANLRALCKKHLPECHQIEIVDVLKEPLKALDDGIIVTPTLVKVSPAPIKKIIGDLGAPDKILAALGLPKEIE